MKTYSVRVTYSREEYYDIEAPSVEVAEEKGKEQFREEHGHGLDLDSIVAKVDFS